MKKGIEAWPKFDCNGNWVLKIKKAKGKLTLEDIRETAQEYEEDYYGLVLKCIGEDSLQYYDDDLDGDAAELYRIADMLEMIGRVKLL